jgi:hypothetical protein
MLVKLIEQEALQKVLFSSGGRQDEENSLIVNTNKGI